MSDNLKLTKPATIEEILTRYMTRYRRLDELIPYAFHEYNVNNINIFIDLYGLYRTIYSRRFRTEVSDYRDFTVGIVNLCSHYRRYFKYIGVHTSIWLVSAHNLPKHNLALIPNYNQIFSDKLKNKIVDQMVNTNIQLLEILCPYLPDIYFVKTEEFEASCLIGEIIRRESISKPDIPNLIISSDLYPIQLTSIMDNTSYLWPSKWSGQDRSMIVCPKSNPDHRNSFWSIVSRKYNNYASEQVLDQISTSNLALLSSLNRFPERNLEPAIINITNSIKYISEVTEGKDVRISPEIVFSYLFNAQDKTYRKYTEEQKHLISDRFKCLDMSYQSIYYNESLEPKLLKYDNLYDPDAVRMINDKYFSDNPMDITSL